MTICDPVAICTPDFNHWFSGSKIVTVAGEPLVLYHGSRPGIAIRRFRIPEYDGAYFTPDPGYAEGFTCELFSDSGAAGAIYPVYLCIRNPLIVEAEPGSTDWEHFVSRGLSREHLEQQGFDGAILRTLDGEIDQVMAIRSGQAWSVIAGGVM
jgi:hypothetical protein